MAIAGDAASQVDSNPDPGVNVIRTFDFEERTTSDWSHAFEQAPGLPRQGLFFDVVTDEEVRRSGGASLRFDLEGGSISYRTRYESSLAISSRTDYRVTGWIRSTGLRQSTARLEVRLVDGYQLDLMIAEGSSRDPVASATRAVLRGDPEPGDDDWGFIDVEINTDLLDEREIRMPRLFIALQVVQPGFDRSDAVLAVGPRRVEVEDVEGQAWFDDISVHQVPRVRLKTLAPGGVVTRDSTVPFKVEIDESLVPSSRPELHIRDLDGVMVQRIPLEFKGRSRMEIGVRPPDVGWYSVDLALEGEIPEGGGPVPILVVPEPRNHRTRVDPRLGISVGEWAPRSLPGLGTAFDVLQPSVVEISAWPEAMDDQPSLEGLQPLKRLLDQQRFVSREVMVAFDRLHAGLAAAAGVETKSVLTSIERDSDGLLVRAVGDWMSGLGTSISRWRFVDDWVSTKIPDALHELADRHVADPSLMVSRPMDHGFASSADGEVCLEVDPNSTAARIEDVVGRDRTGWTARISPPPSEWAPRDRVAAAALRLLKAWIGGADRILFPWVIDRGPDPSLMAWTGLAEAIDGRRFLGSIPTGPTTRSLVAGDEHGVVVVTQALTKGEGQSIRLPVGDQPVEIVDLDGRREWASPTDGLLELVVGPLPRMIHGADRMPVGIAASARIQPTHLPLDSREHQLELILENPVMNSISGMIRLEPRSGWTFEPSVAAFQSELDSNLRIPVTVRWDGPQRVGRNIIRGWVELEGGGAPIPVEFDLNLESRSLLVTADWSVAPGADPPSAPLIVELRIENVGDRILDLEVDASAWKLGRESRLVTGLHPGEHEVRRFLMKSGLDRLAGTDIRIELRDLDGEDGLVLDLPIRREGQHPSDSDPDTRTAVVRP